MLTRIVHPSSDLVTFVESLGLPLTEPQKRHLINLANGILVAEDAEIFYAFLCALRASRGE